MSLRKQHPYRNTTRKKERAAKEGGTLGVAKAIGGP